MSSQFTISERTDAQGGSLAILARFVSELPLLLKLFPLYLLCMTAGILVPQVFLWMTGHLSNCSAINDCRVVEPIFSSEMNLTPLMLLLMVALAVFLKIASWVMFEISGQWAALRLHGKLIERVAHVRTTFFDEYPSGKLINRLVRDFESLRMTGVIRMGDFLNALAEVIIGASVVAWTYPAGALLIVPVVIVFLYIQWNVAAMLHRCGTLRSVRFGEVLHRETDIIEGGRTFVLYGKERSLGSRLQKAVSGYIQAHFLTASIEAWGRFWSGLVASLYAFAAYSMVAYGLHSGAVSAVAAAVIMTVVLRLSPSFGWLGWITAYLLDSVAVARRIFEFVDLPHETIQEGKAAAVSANGKSPGCYLEGDIEFKNYSMSYRAESPIILDHLDLKLPRGKRIGIIGRTGAGKSSLIQSLFRMVHVRAGDITIGGESIFSFGVDYVRSHFSVIPQDPYLFEGTIRENLDRGGEFSDEQLEQALCSVGIDYPLNHPIQESGRNISLGERQLLCLARTIMQKRPFMLMDEATSGIDTISDAKIQRVLAEELRDCTVVTIAHRLETLHGYDLIVELENGRVERIGRPGEILQGVGADLLM